MSLRKLHRNLANFCAFFSAELKVEWQVGDATTEVDGSRVTTAFDAQGISVGLNRTRFWLGCRTVELDRERDFFLIVKCCIAKIAGNALEGAKGKVLITTSWLSHTHPSVIEFSLFKQARHTRQSRTNQKNYFYVMQLRVAASAYASPLRPHALYIITCSLEYR